jgi:hypothetical protein
VFNKFCPPENRADFEIMWKNTVQPDRAGNYNIIWTEKVRFACPINKADTHTHTYTHSHIHTHAHTHTRSRTRARTYSRTQTRARTHTHAHTYTYARTHTHIHTHAITYTHTHTQYPVLIIVSISTKHFVTRQRCKRNPLLHFHGNNVTFILPKFIYCKRQKLKIESTSAFPWQQLLRGRAIM